MGQSAFEYIDSDAALRDVSRKIRDASSISIDTEANSLHNYFERVCLIQITIEDEHFIVDPLAEVDMDILMRVLGKKELILHGSDYDLRLMRSTFGFTPNGQVFDTMLAAQLLGMERIGYAALVEEFFDVKLSKAGQKSNWAKRPLSDSQLKYAADDTRYLGALSEALRGELEARGRDQWHAEWCDKVLESTRVDTVRDQEEAWRIRGLGVLDRRQLSYVREIWRWRDGEARDSDRPPFKILGNAQIVELAEWASENTDAELDQGPRLPRHCEGGRLQRLKSALNVAKRLSKSEWPEKRRRREKSENNRDYRAQVDALRAECAKLADELDVPASVLAPKGMLTAVARNDARTATAMKACSGIMNWQAELIEEPVNRVLAQF